jgi:hypothetical protein
MLNTEGSFFDPKRVEITPGISEKNPPAQKPLTTAKTAL